MNEFVKHSSCIGPFKSRTAPPCVKQVPEALEAYREELDQLGRIHQTQSSSRHCFKAFPPKFRVEFMPAENFRRYQP